MNNSKQIHFIINPISGGKNKDDLANKLKTHLSPEIHFECHFTKGHLDATKLTKEAVKNGADAVIAVGGDGSVNEVASGLIDSNVALGILPFGSGNGFARHFGIPMNTVQAIKKINEFKTQQVDVAYANEEPFFALAGIGFDASVGKSFDEHSKRGFLTYTEVAFQEYRNYQPFNLEMEVDGVKQSYQPFLISIANTSQYGNNAWIAPKAKADDGLLEVCILNPFPNIRLLEVVWQLFNKKITDSSYYECFSGKEIKITGIHEYHIDGEPKKCKGVLLIRIQSDALKVII